MKKLSITIGIPAFNEEKNIASLLNSIFSQKGNNFLINEVIVISDGSTDKTEEIVRNCQKKYSKITLIKSRKRKGKANRLNALYKSLKSDIFVSFDADVVLSHPLVISELIKGFTSDKIGLVGGQSVPAIQPTLLGKSLKTYEYFWSKVVKSIHSGNNVHTHKGPISAASSKFLRGVTIPKGIVAEDHFIYFEALNQGYKYVFRSKATVTIKLPNSLREYFHQQTRFISSAEGVINYFGPWVEKEYAIPYKKKLNAYIETGKKYPIYLLLALGIVSLQRVYGYIFQKNYTSSLWKQITTSK